MKRYLTLFLIAFTISATAQSQITGSLKDSDSKEPLAFANVMVFKNGKLLSIVQSDINGEYSVQEISNGKYNLEFSYAGYSNLKILNLEVNENGINNMEVNLKAGNLISYPNMYPINQAYQPGVTSVGHFFTNDEVRRAPFRL